MNNLELVTGGALELHLGVSRSTLWRLRQEGLPVRRVGKAVRYNLLEVEQWLNSKPHHDLSLNTTATRGLHAEHKSVASHPALFLDADNDPNPESPRPDSVSIPPCHWSRAVALDPKHRPQTLRRPSSTVRREWWRFPQEAHLLDEDKRKYRRLRASEIAVLQGFPSDWGVKSGLAELDLIRGYGNAVPPPLAQVLLESLKELVPNLPKTSLEVCAGFGGLALGASRAGFDHLSLMDFWGPAVQVLKSTGPWRAEDVHQADITTVDWSSLKGRVGVLSGGPPCQPWSAAGQGKGSDDERDLLGFMPDLIKDLMPTAFILENVPGLLQGENEPYARWLIERLRNPSPGLNYGCVAGVLNAADFGVPQVRKRVFIVGILDAEVPFVHKFFDAIYSRRTHSDPRRIIPSGRQPWVTVGEALPEYECEQSGWRRWIEMPETDNRSETASSVVEARRPKILPPILGLTWPSRGKTFGWDSGSWVTLPIPHTEISEEYRPLLLNAESKGHPQRDPWFVIGDPAHTLAALHRTYGRSTQLVYLDVPRLRTDDSSFASDDQYARLDTWLTVLRGLLVRAITLLDDSGAIVVLCGTIESPYVELQLNELLGPGNRVGTIAWQKAYAPRNMEGMTEITATHDNLVIFAKRREECLAPVHLLVPPDDLNNDGDPRGPWKAEHKGANKPDVSYETHVPPYDWSIIKGELPPGFWRLCEKSGVIWADANSVSQVGKWDLEIEVKDQEGKKARKKFTIEVTQDAKAPEPNAPPWLIVRRDAKGAVSNEVKSGRELKIMTPDLPPARVGFEYSALLIASGGKPFQGRVRPGEEGRSIFEVVVESDCSVRQLARTHKVNPNELTLKNGQPLELESTIPAGTTVCLTRHGRYWEYTATTLEQACARFDLHFGSQKRSSIPAIKRHIPNLQPLNQTSTWITESGLKREDPRRIGWTEDAKKELQTLQSMDIIKEVPKPVISKPSGLVGRLIALFSREGGTVIDIGSPTAEMASISCALNRRAIYVELPSDSAGRTKQTLPRLAAASRGEHPLPTGAFFQPSTNESKVDVGYFCGISPRGLYPAASPCLFELGSIALKVKRDPRVAEIDYHLFPAGSDAFLQMIASLEGLVPTLDAMAIPNCFATGSGGLLKAIYVPSSIFLSIGKINSILQDSGMVVPDGRHKLRIYFHRGLDPLETELPSNVELRRVPYDLDTVGARVRG